MEELSQRFLCLCHASTRLLQETFDPVILECRIWCVGLLSFCEVLLTVPVGALSVADTSEISGRKFVRDMGSTSDGNSTVSQCGKCEGGARRPISRGSVTPQDRLLRRLFLC